ncbi:LacI family DNA-binding transcriptional regulator [Pseudotenacibaculum sp. MALMAid0570]|uniref:LacI family DNA-binding transcriptional regulator n=1 Tax=Pseudotenacibaculum sp. MALMAid0570 TaxID=3143938 RepID=UPI0032DE3D6D
MTLKELSKISGYSISTISKAINDSYEISSSTKKKILRIVKKHNYKPNFFALNLKKKENFIIGVILPDFKDEYFLNALIGITEESSRLNHRIMVYQSCNDSAKEKEYIKLLYNNVVDGLIFSPIDYKSDFNKNKNLSILHKNDYPIITINKRELGSSNEQLKGHYTGRNSVQELLEKINNKNSALLAS